MLKWARKTHNIVILITPGEGILVQEKCHVNRSSDAECIISLVFSLLLNIDQTVWINDGECWLHQKYCKVSWPTAGVRVLGRGHMDNIVENALITLLFYFIDRSKLTLFKVASIRFFLKTLILKKETMLTLIKSF